MSGEASLLFEISYCFIGDGLQVIDDYARMCMALGGADGLTLSILPLQTFLGIIFSVNTMEQVASVAISRLHVFGL